MLTRQDYETGSKRLGAPVAYLMGVAEVESSGTGFVTVGGQSVPVIRLEAHHFSARTAHQYDRTYPTISSRVWNPELAANTQAGAWLQLGLAERLNKPAADEATSWGAFQVMGFNWRALKYPSVAAFVASMATDAGQLEAFERFIEADPLLKRALQEGDWQTFERRYNGGGYGGAYAAKIAAAVSRYAAADDGSSVPRALKLGDKGIDVEALQAALGIFPVDGDFGPATDAAVRAFQIRKGLVVDGIAGRMTKAELGIVK